MGHVQPRYPSFLQNDAGVRRQHIHPRQREGEWHFVKIHFTPTLGVHSFVWDEALKMAGQDPDFHRKDLYKAISMSVFPTWKFGIQTMKESLADDFDFDP